MNLFHPLPGTGASAAGAEPGRDWHVVEYDLAVVAVLRFLCLATYRYWEVPTRTLLRNMLDPQPKPTFAVVPAGPAPARRAA
jgi:hypothetical protein